LITRRRIECELYYLKDHKPKNVLDVAIHNEHVWEWKITILGPQGTPYEGGYFHLGIRFLPDHPRSPPIVVFVTRVHHPNIALNVCFILRLNVLHLCLGRGEHANIETRVGTDDNNRQCKGFCCYCHDYDKQSIQVLNGIQYLLAHPSATTNTLNVHATQEMCTNREAFEKSARNCTKAYAHAVKFPSHH
jgi:ubiquitin-protein ligase